MTVVNSLELCEGLITRERFRDGKLEQSVLDFFVVCNLLLPYLKKMVIDEDRKFILTNYEQVQRGGKQQILLNFLNAFKANSLFWSK